MSSKILFTFSATLICAVVVNACFYNGQLYINGQQWIEKNTFVMQCTFKGLLSWYTEVVACLTPSKAKIPVGEWLIEGRFNYSCYMREHGTVWIKYDPIWTEAQVGNNGTKNTQKCEGNHDIGTRWREWSFLFECSRNATITFLGCLTESGLLIPANQTAVSRGLKFSCHLSQNRTATFNGVKVFNNTPMLKEGKEIDEEFKKDKLKNCLDFNNGTRKIGEYWIEKENFNMTCNADGRTTLVNCINLNKSSLKNYSCDLYTDTFAFIKPTQASDLIEPDANVNLTNIVCQEHAKYKTCLRCQPTCGVPRAQRNCAAECKEGCECEIGYVWHLKKCIKASECPEGTKGYVQTHLAFFDNKLPLAQPSKASDLNEIDDSNFAIECQEHAKYKTCVRCQPTCGVPRAQRNCDAECKEGCECDIGYVWHLKQCIKAIECPKGTKGYEQTHGRKK